MSDISKRFYGRLHVEDALTPSAPHRDVQSLVPQLRTVRASRCQSSVAPVRTPTKSSFFTLQLTWRQPAVRHRNGAERQRRRVDTGGDAHCKPGRAPIAAGKVAIAHKVRMATAQPPPLCPGQLKGANPALQRFKAAAILFHRLRQRSGTVALCWTTHARRRLGRRH